MLVTRSKTSFFWSTPVSVCPPAGLHKYIKEACAPFHDYYTNINSLPNNHYRSNIPKRAAFDN